MRCYKLLLLALLAVFMLSPARAEVQLQAKYPDKFWVELKSEFKRVFRAPKGDIKDRTDTTQVLGISVLKANADGSMVVEVTIESFNEITTDDKGKQKEGRHAGLVGSVVQATLDPTMTVTKLEGVDAVLKKGDPQGKSKLA